MEFENRKAKKTFPLYSPPSPLILEKRERVNTLEQGRFLSKFSKTVYFQRIFALMYFQVEYFDQLQFYAFTVVEIFNDRKNAGFKSLVFCALITILSLFSAKRSVTINLEQEVQNIFFFFTCCVDV